MASPSKKPKFSIDYLLGLSQHNGEENHHHQQPSSSNQQTAANGQIGGAILSRDLSKFIKSIYEEEDVEFNNKFKFQKWRGTYAIEDIPTDNPENLLRQLFQECIDKAIGESRQNGIEPDNLGLTISSELLQYDIWIPVRGITENTVDAAIHRFELVAQSKTNEGNLLGEPFAVTVTTVDKKQLASSARQRQLNGSGGIVQQIQHRIHQKCLIPVKNEDSYCLFHALHLTRLHKLKKLTNENFYKLVHRDHNRRWRQVEELMIAAEIPFGLSSYDARTYVPKIVNYWNVLDADRQNRYKVFVFEAYGNFKPAFMNGPQDFNVPVVLYYDSKHFWGVRSVASMIERNNYCLSCLSPYTNAKLHRKDCARLCLNCGRMGKNCSLVYEQMNYERFCGGCNKKFLNEYFSFFSNIFKFLIV